MKTKKKTKNICRVNLECPNSPCDNYLTCEDLGKSWEIPYVRNKDGLYVKQYGFRYDWTVEDLYIVLTARHCAINGAECGFYNPVSNPDDYCADMHNIEMNKRVVESWLEAGFCAAVLIPSMVRCGDYSDCEIPF